MHKKSNILITLSYTKAIHMHHVLKLKRLNSELGASLFEIAQSLFALERTLILGAMALNKNKSEER